MSASRLFMVNLNSTESAVAALEYARAVIGEVRLEPPVFVYSPAFNHIEQVWTPVLHVTVGPLFGDMYPGFPVKA